MKINIYEQGGNMDGGYTMPGMTLTGPLLVTVPPTAGNHAVNKQYVDTASTNLNASDVKSGTLAATHLPEYVGDIHKLEGNTNINLLETGISPGEYTKVTVNSKGFITAGSVMSDTDLPDLSWNKLSLDRPDTLSGYGITDALSLGGTVTGQLTLASGPVISADAATKQYVDGAGTSGGGLVAGDIINRLVPATPTGYLKCNGAVLSKTTYADLYAVVGDGFSTIVPAGNGRPWEQQSGFGKIDSFQSSTWKQDGNFPAFIVYGTVLMTKNRAYYIGGFNYESSTVSTSVFTTAINADGTFAGWTSTTALPYAVNNATCFVTVNRVYILGGAATNNMITAVINTDGTLGAWEIVAKTPPYNLNIPKVIVTKNRVYLLSARANGGNLTTMYTCTFGTDGIISNWTTAGSLPISGMNENIVLATRNRVYIIGGRGNQDVSTSIFVASINQDGTLGSWSNSGLTLPIATYGVSDGFGFVSRSKAFIVLTYGPSGFNKAHYEAPINPDGSLGTWSVGSTSSLPGINITSVCVTSSRVYLVTSYNNTTGYSNAIYSNVITGGTNDYSPYYDGSFVTTDPNSFALPDYTRYEEPGYYFFIKT